MDENIQVEKKITASLYSNPKIEFSKQNKRLKRPNIAGTKIFKWN